MKIRDAARYQKETKQQPAGVIVAFSEPHSINEVILQDNWRFRIVKKLTRDEFVDQLKANLSHENCVAGIGNCDGSRISMEDAVDAIEPPEYMKYFYAVDLI